MQQSDDDMQSGEHRDSESLQKRLVKKKVVRWAVLSGGDWQALSQSLERADVEAFSTARYVKWTKALSINLTKVCVSRKG